jgi:hypothetical protein
MITTNAGCGRPDGRVGYVAHRAQGAPCTPEASPPAYYGTPWIALAERYVLAAREAGIDPLIAITTNSAARYAGNGKPNDPPNPSANQYLCGFEGIVSTIDAFAARHGVAPPTEYEAYDEPDGARVSNACNPTPDGDMPPGDAEQCAAWYYDEADVANRTMFGDRLTLVALAADGDSANDPNLIAIKGYGSYLTGTIGLYPAVWSFHPYEVGTYFGLPEGCNDGEADDPPPYTLGGCLDGNPRAQAYAASDFLSLARSGSAFSGQITRIYWHESDGPAAHPTTWDSGLVSPGDRYERASYCVLAGESVARALSDPTCNSKVGAEDSQDSCCDFGSRRWTARRHRSRSSPAPAKATCKTRHVGRRLGGVTCCASGSCRIRHALGIRRRVTSYAGR